MRTPQAASRWALPHISSFCILFVPGGGQPKIVNNSDEFINEVQELRAELAKSNDKIAAMSDEFAQLKETVSGEKLYTCIQK